MASFFLNRWQTFLNCHRIFVIFGWFYLRHSISVILEDILDPKINNSVNYVIHLCQSLFFIMTRNWIFIRNFVLCVKKRPLSLWPTGMRFSFLLLRTSSWFFSKLGWFRHSPNLSFVDYQGEITLFLCKNTF